MLGVPETLAESEADWVTLGVPERLKLCVWLCDADCVKLAVSDCDEDCD